MNKLSPYLRKNGGPILMIQVENEYGLFGVCDRPYGIWLRDMMRQKVGNDTVLYTSMYIILCFKIKLFYS